MKIHNLYLIFRQMGPDYILFRISHELLRRSGLLKLKYPVKYRNIKCPCLKEWRADTHTFFYDDGLSFQYSSSDKECLKEDILKIRSGIIQFFTYNWIDLGREYDWALNPDNGYRYNKDKHWTKIHDIDTLQGDIKYVWEKARFAWLYLIFRNDLANEEDNSQFVWDEIISFTKSTTYNCGPHYKCSQEISIRVLNWIFALYFYKNKQSLTETIFTEITSSIYWQTKHVEQNILFSTIAVRNNHAITEALCLFTVGLLFPSFPQAGKWFKHGKEILEREGLYQIYDDGSYIQHSFNYQRVVVQLYSWALALAKRNNVLFAPALIERLKKCVAFLNQFADSQTGHVPDWGPNDSALFFPLNGCDPRDFRPQLNALNALLNDTIIYPEDDLQEDCAWFGVLHRSEGTREVKPDQFTQSFNSGGYYVIKTGNSDTFIRCTQNKNRPYHADNLHLDLWFNHENLLRDSGTYKYNTEPLFSNFFSGTLAHNTVSINDLDQMKKGARFIWYNWSRAVYAFIREEPDFFIFEGCIEAFRQLNEGILHKRTVRVNKNTPLWLVHDTIIGADGNYFSQYWNISDRLFENGFAFKALSEGKEILPEQKDAWYSKYYGQKQPSKQIVFRFTSAEILTAIYHESVKQTIGSYLK